MEPFKYKRHHSKKDKKLIKLIRRNSGSDNEGSEHELSYYLNDRVKMMKEVLKIIKPRQIKSMAPECMKTMDIEEINSMLLEELLGISNKRLKHIFNGQNLNEESSSTDPEDQPIDIISLDDISDDELIIDLDSDNESKQKPRKHKTKFKQECRRKRIKREKHDKEVENNKKGSKSLKKETGQISDANTELNPMSEKNLMSVLELLELQARARAIRSQLALENCKSSQPEPPTYQPEPSTQDQVDDEDAVIVENPKNEEIIITSDSETEHLTNQKENGNEKQRIEEHQLESDSEREKSAVSIHKVRIIQKNTVKKSQGNKDIFWKNSHRDSTSSSNDQIIQQTAVREVENNSENDSDVNGFNFPNKNNAIIDHIPLPGTDDLYRQNDETLENNCLNNVDTENLKTNLEKGKKIDLSSYETIDKDSIPENKGEAIESNTKNISSEDTQTNSKKSNTLIENKTEETHTTGLLEINVEAQETTTTSKNEHKLCRRKTIKTHKSAEVKRVDESNNIIDDNEGIILDVDQSEIDCINLD